MTAWEQKIKRAQEECLPWKVDIIQCAKAYLEVQHKWRSHPYGLQSFHGPENDPVWAEYYSLSEAYKTALSNLWMATDLEYSDDDIAMAAWEWRYWKVMCRKCCYYQKSMHTSHLASKTMNNLQKAEEHLMEVCGLNNFYKSSNYYLELHLPNLKNQ